MKSRNISGSWKEGGLKRTFNVACGSRGLAIFILHDFPATYQRPVLFEFAVINLQARANFRFRVRKLQPFISRYASTLINENVEKSPGRTIAGK